MEQDEEIKGATGKEEEMPGAAGKEEEMPKMAGMEEEKMPDEEEEKIPAGSQCCLEAVLPTGWCVSYTTLLVCRNKPTHKGSMVMRADVNRIVLYDSDNEVIDVRPLHEGELIYPGSVVHFPCHKVDVGECIFQPDIIIKNEDVLTPNLVTSPQLIRAVDHQLPFNEDHAPVGKENGEKKRNKKDELKKKRRKLEEKQEIRDEKKRKLEEKQQIRDEKKRKLEEEQEIRDEKKRKLEEKQQIRDEKKRKLEEEQEMRDEKKKKRLKVAAMRKTKIPEENSEMAEELRRKNRDIIKEIKKEKQTVRSPGVKLVRSPLAMFAKVASLRKEMSPQDKLSGSVRRPRKLKSKIWKEVIPIYKHGKLVQGQCKHCNDIFAASRKSGTNHIHRHLRICETRSRMHELVAKMCASTSSPQVPDLGKWEFSQEKSRRELANMVALHDFPFSIVEYSGFRKFVKSLNPLFKFVSRTTVRDDCLESFREERSALREIFNTCGCRVSLTADMWTSVQRLGYLCVTCHYIDKSWKIQKRIIRFCLMESPHDGLQMYNMMLKTIQYWHIEDKLCSITLDNASVNGSMMSDLRNNLYKRHLLIGDGALFHIRCAAHVLNLIVQDGLRVMDGIIDNIRETVKYIRSSQAREELFDNVVEKLGIECKKKPSLDVASRWNSTYLMIESVFPYQEAFVELGKQDKQFTFAPSEKEWGLAEELRKLLQTFYGATKVVSGTNYPTSNRYFHEIWNVKVLLDRQANNKNVVIASMVYQMQQKFDKYWKESYLANCIPLIFDPRYKRGFVVFRLEQAFGKDSEEHIAKMDKVIHKLFEEYSLQIGEFVADNSEEEDDADIVPEAEDPLADWEAHLKVQKKQVTSELDRYLNEDRFPRRKVFNILGWWKLNAPKYPVLSCIARDVLAVQASTVASESAFSIGGRVVSDYRSRLKSDTVEALICLQDWLRAADPSVNKTTTTDVDDEECQILVTMPPNLQEYIPDH